MDTFKQAFAASDKAILNAVGDNALLDGLPVRGKFDAPWLQPEIGTMRTGILEPTFTAPGTVIYAAVKGSLLEFDGDGYDVIKKPKPDGTGMTTLILRPKA